MKRMLVTLLVMAASVGGCSDDDGDEASAIDSASDGTEQDGDSSAGDDTSGDDSSGGAVVDPAPPGQATASVDGQEFTFELPGALDCSISDDSITFSFRIGDNEVTLGGGLNPAGGGWIGSIDLSVANPSDEDGPIGYYPNPGDDATIDASLVAVDGQSMSYSGPMLKQPANDGSNPPPVDVGDGTISATCG